MFFLSLAVLRYSTIILVLSLGFSFFSIKPGHLITTPLMCLIALMAYGLTNVREVSIVGDLLEAPQERRTHQAPRKSELILLLSLKEVIKGSSSC